jgi:hypothetical protein
MELDRQDIKEKEVTRELKVAEFFFKELKRQHWFQCGIIYSRVFPLHLLTYPFFSNVIGRILDCSIFAVGHTNLPTSTIKEVSALSCCNANMIKLFL